MLTLVWLHVFDLASKNDFYGRKKSKFELKFTLKSRHAAKQENVMGKQKFYLLF